jgi:hypothetical protein
MAARDTKGIVASEVAVALCIGTLRAYTRMGTSAIPPPTPKKLPMSPARVPIAAKPTTSRHKALPPVRGSADMTPMIASRGRGGKAPERTRRKTRANRMGRMDRIQDKRLRRRAERAGPTSQWPHAERVLPRLVASFVVDLSFC